MRDVFDRVEEIATVLPPESWVLIGGLMVHAHAELAGIVHNRPTDDADLVVDLEAVSYPEAAVALQRLGYERHESLDHRAPFHRFERGAEQVDLMVPDRAEVRFAGRDVLAVPGSRSALRRTTSYRTRRGVLVRIPDIESALSLKGAAFGTPSPNRIRHLQDAVTLFACAGGVQLDISKSMRRNINVLIAALDNMEAWTHTDPLTRRRAVRAIHTVRPQWVTPPPVIPGRPPRPPQGERPG